MYNWLAILFSLFIILIIILADMGKLGFVRFINSIPYGDKAGHFILYGLLTLFIDLVYLRSPRTSNRKFTVIRIALILALLIGLEEFSQKYFSRRTFDYLDLTFSYLGVVCFSWLSLKFN